MTENSPLTPRPLRQLADVQRLVMTSQQLRAHGVSLAAAHERCRPGGPWQMPLPGVFLLHAGPPTGDEILHAALGYIGGREGEAVVSGLAALALHGFTGAPPLTALDRVDVLVPRTRRLRTAGFARVVRTHRLPRPVELGGFPVAPVPRALADAIARLPDQLAVRRLLTEAVRGGHCDPQAVIRELTRARLLSHPHVATAIDALLVEGRTMAEERLLETVRAAGLPDPCWNVALWLPDGPFLCAMDAYWPEQAVAVEIDARGPRQRADDAERTEHDRTRQTLTGLGITVIRTTPRKLRESPGHQADAVRQALRAAAGRPPATYVVVMPR
ncbi:hypothetical protein [Streptomyces sp. NBC_01803]|uniref:hypothetical protein n=1 Tax=Streptomyces sp. NBC_01803 TaxID=2975946 RepID=UPI002DD9FE9F|nr:hypothetical protein [Streptomyces sp. NBC_01803]WSA46205.1 endonuclease domain-containing protein [Streptomyces sp. NBC_01803]